MNIDRRGFLIASSSALALGTSGVLPAASDEPPATPTRAEVDRQIEANDDRRLHDGERHQSSPFPDGHPGVQAVQASRSRRRSASSSIRTKRFADRCSASAAHSPMRRRRRSPSCRRPKQRSCSTPTSIRNKGIGYTLGANQHPQLRLLERQLHVRRRRRHGAQVVQRRA